MFVSEQWKKSDYAKKAIGKRVERILAKQEFWDNIFLACQIFAPLVDVVRLVDTEEKPCMGYIYDAMERAKDQIKKNLTNTPHERLIMKVWSMIQARWSDPLHHPLHAGIIYKTFMFNSIVNTIIGTNFCSRILPQPRHLLCTRFGSGEY